MHPSRLTVKQRWRLAKRAAKAAATVHSVLTKAKTKVGRRDRYTVTITIPRSRLHTVIDALTDIEDIHVTRA